MYTLPQNTNTACLQLRYCLALGTEERAASGLCKDHGVTLAEWCVCVCAYMHFTSGLACDSRSAALPYIYHTPAHTDAQNLAQLNVVERLPLMRVEAIDRSIDAQPR